MAHERDSYPRNPVKIERPEQNGLIVSTVKSNEVMTFLVPLLLGATLAAASLILGAQNRERALQNGRASRATLGRSVESYAFSRLRERIVVVSSGAATCVLVTLLVFAGSPSFLLSFGIGFFGGLCLNSLRVLIRLAKTRPSLAPPG